MRLTSKGQVTIPKHIREKLGVAPGDEVGFREEGSAIMVENAKMARQDGTEDDFANAVRRFREKHVVKDENKDLEAIDEIAKRAATQFAAARKIPDQAARNKAIRGAMETLAGAQEKLQTMSELPKYQGEEFELVFGPRFTRMTQEMKTYRDAIKRFIAQ